MDGVKWVKQRNLSVNLDIGFIDFIYFLNSEVFVCIPGSMLFFKMLHYCKRRPMLIYCIQFSHTANRFGVCLFFGEETIKIPI